MLDIDGTVKALYGKQQEARVGYNPTKPGRPSHVYHACFIARLCMVLRIALHPRTRWHRSSLIRDCLAGSTCARGNSDRLCYVKTWRGVRKRRWARPRSEASLSIQTATNPKCVAASGGVIATERLGVPRWRMAGRRERIAVAAMDEEAVGCHRAEIVGEKNNSSGMYPPPSGPPSPTSPSTTKTTASWSPTTPAWWPPSAPPFSSSSASPRPAKARSCRNLR